MRTKDDLVKEFNKLSMNIMPIFKIGVINKEKGRNEYVLCQLYVNDTEIYLRRGPVTREEKENELITRNSIPLNPIRCLNDHIFELYDTVCDDIMSGDLYELI